MRRFIKLTNFETATTLLTMNTTTTHRPAPGAPIIPVNVLESFIPGYAIISQFLFDSFGFDTTGFVSTAFLAVAMITAINYGFDRIYKYWSRYCTSTIYISSDDAIYTHAMSWISERGVTQTSRSLKAKSKGFGWEAERRRNNNDKDNGGTTFNYKDWEAKEEPHYSPYFGKHTFWFKGNWFSFQRNEKTLSGGRWSDSPVIDAETISFTCIGRSTDPIKRLLQTAKSNYLEIKKSSTTIWRSNGSPYHLRWEVANSRPSRPLDTVSMEDELKNKVVSDIDQFLDPSAPKWYSSRGIPYRRGYLFHGPPGTGKTSLSFALAGLFGLDIYVLTLSDRQISEENLKKHFNQLPRRCIVLLEDIDTAGVRREPNEPVDDTRDRGGRRKEADGISLSGLLNAIDGVASQEGRILIMTTNHPQLLDKALVRPGRVDLSVEFGNASKEQTRRLFQQMYTNENGETEEKKLIRLGHDSEKFADMIPDLTFTPAELQGFLLTRRNNQGKAVDEVEEWRDDLLKTKRKESEEEAQRILPN